MRSLRDLGVAALRRRWVNIVVTSMIKLYLFCCIQENIIARNRSKSLEEFPLDATLLCISRWAQQNAILIHLLVLVKLEVKLKCYIDSFQVKLEARERKNETSKQIVLYAGKLDLPTDNDKLRAHLQGMQWRVTELERVCMRMQAPMTKIMKSRVSNHRTSDPYPGYVR
ncbi:hypothetical protein H0E87_028552 [Populus deltoides]|uniref:Uncharacterized protein n=1 Tax=Populus deltoides TaxID=3696 RepID=A0A8T2WVK7_POPDE|nr:hypothetical protein H0E87_028552 [Populus deltoides]